MRRGRPFFNRCPPAIPGTRDTVDPPRRTGPGSALHAIARHRPIDGLEEAGCGVATSS